MAYTLKGILLKREQDNGGNNMTNQKHRDKNQSKIRERSLGERREQNEEADDLKIPPDMDRRDGLDRRTQSEDQ